MERGGDVDALVEALEQLLRLNASRNVHNRRAAAAGVAISQPGFALLRRLGEDGPLPLGELARRTDMDTGATSRQVRQLEQDGLVVKRTDAGDARVTVVQVTPAGTAVRRRLATVGTRHMEDVLDRWSATDRTRLATLLSRFVDDLRSVHYRAEAEERAG